MGFEPTIRLHAAYTLSWRAPSTARPSLQCAQKRNCKVKNYLSEIKIFNDFFSRHLQEITKVYRNKLTNKYILLDYFEKFSCIIRCYFAHIIVTAVQNLRHFFGYTSDKSRLVALSTMRNRCKIRRIGLQNNIRQRHFGYHIGQQRLLIRQHSAYTYLISHIQNLPSRFVIFRKTMENANQPR